MKILVTGSAGHLGEALMRSLENTDHEAMGVDIKSSPFTRREGSITERSFVKQCMQGVDVVLHTATLHKPHIATHSRQDFVDTNITGTLNLLEEAVAASVESFVYTSTTSVFGDALVPPQEAPAAWITEDVAPVPKNIYGVTKAAAEDLCELFHRNQSLACVVLRTSRFFPEEDDNLRVRNAYSDANAKANEFLYRRVDIEDVSSAHLLAAKHAAALGFRKYIISATTPFRPSDLADLRVNAPGVRVAVVMPGHVGTDIIANSIRARGLPELEQLTDAQVEELIPREVQAKLIRAGLLPEGASADDLRRMLVQANADFRDKAPVSAAQAATTILDGVRSGAWRILVGADAEKIDAAVRAKPESAYDYAELFSALAAEPAAETP